MNHNKLLRERSGEIDSDDDLAAIFYTFMIDGDISPGRLEEVVREHLEVKNKAGTFQYSNGWVAQYAIDLSKRLRGE